MRDEQEVAEEYNEAIAATVERNGKYPGMTYEEGVRDALAWVTEERDDAPISGDLD